MSFYTRYYFLSLSLSPLPFFSFIFFAFQLQLFKDKRKPSAQEIEYIRSFSQLIEVIYDPYLTWRNFLHGHFADYRRILTNIVQLHVELVPFIYGILNSSYSLCIPFPIDISMDQNHFDNLYIISDCFQFETIIHLPEIGVPLIHMLGAIISGSQVFFFHCHLVGFSFQFYSSFCLFTF